jgi:putative transposase
MQNRNTCKIELDCRAAPRSRSGNWRTRRIYRELGLQLRNKTPKRPVKAKLREDRRPATRSNETWAMDFVHYQLAIGRKLRILTIVDTFSRFSPALEPRFTFRGADVVEVLERVGRQVGFPTTIRVDQRVRVAQFHRGKPDRRILELLSLDRED